MAKSKKQIRALYRKKYAKQKSQLAAVELQLTPEQIETYRQIKSRKSKKAYIKIKMPQQAKSQKITIPEPKVLERNFKKEVSAKNMGFYKALKNRFKGLNDYILASGLTADQFLDLLYEQNKDVTSYFYDEEIMRQIEEGTYEDEFANKYEDAMLSKKESKKRIQTELDKVMVDAKKIKGNKSEMQYYRRSFNKRNLDRIKAQGKRVAELAEKYK